MNIYTYIFISLYSFFVDAQCTKHRGNEAKYGGMFELLEYKMMTISLND